MNQIRKPAVDALGATVLIIFSGLLGLNQALVKLVNVGFSPVFQVGLRSLCAFFPVLLFALIMKKRLSLSDGSLVPGFVSGLFFSLEFCLLFIALEYTSVARVSVLFYTMPIWISLGGHFLIPGERLTAFRLGALMLAVLGIALALLDGDWSTNPNSMIGDLLALAGSFCWAGIALIARTTQLSKSSPEMQLLYQLFISALLLVAIAPLFGNVIRDLTPMIIGIFTFQVFAIAAIGFVVWFWALSVYPASDMASFSLLAPIFGVFFGWLIFDDQLSPFLLIALVLVAAGIALINHDTSRRNKLITQEQKT